MKGTNYEALRFHYDVSFVSLRAKLFSNTLDLICVVIVVNNNRKVTQLCDVRMLAPDSEAL
jgi:hypothetical protein